MAKPVTLPLRQRRLGLGHRKLPFTIDAPSLGKKTSERKNAVPQPLTHVALHRVVLVVNSYVSNHAVPIDVVGTGIVRTVQVDR